MPDASVSANVDERTLDEFDETFGCGDYGSNSRSQAIENAMKMAVTVESAWSTVGLSFEAMPTKRHSTQQAILLWDEYDRRMQADR